MAVVTRDRRDSLLATLERLVALPEAPPVLVVDNASSDGTAVAVAERFGTRVEVVRLRENRGAVARTVGAERLGTPFVAFADDDSWWEPGALRRAAGLFESYPRLGLLAARVLLEGGVEDPVCAAMASSPLVAGGPLPGRAVLGFVACAAVVRRDAFLASGGFPDRLGTGAEEELLALDLAARGWDLAYVPELVVQHRPSPARDRAARRRLHVRNRLWSAWLRRRPAAAAGRTARVLGEAWRDGAGRRGVVDALGGLPWVLRERRAVPRALEDALRMLERREP